MRAERKMLPPKHYDGPAMLWGPALRAMLEEKQMKKQLKCYRDMKGLTITGTARTTYGSSLILLFADDSFAILSSRQDYDDDPCVVVDTIKLNPSRHLVKLGIYTQMELYKWEKKKEKGHAVRELAELKRLKEKYESRDESVD